MPFVEAQARPRPANHKAQNLSFRLRFNLRTKLRTEPAKYRPKSSSMTQQEARRFSNIANLKATVGPRFKSWRAHQLLFEFCQHSQLTCPFFALSSNLRTSENKTPASRSTAPMRLGPR